MPDSHKNFAVSTVATAPSPATSGTSLVVQAGHGTRFPTVPFNAVVWPTGTTPSPANAEVVRVTNIATDTLTITRATESSSARTVIVGDNIACGITSKLFTDIEAQLSPNVVVLNGITYAQTRAGLQAAHDALPSTGGTIIIPAGVTITEDGTQFTVTKDFVRIQGEGPTSVIKLQNSATQLFGIHAYGSAGSTYNLNSNAAEGAVSVVLTGGSGANFLAGDYIYLSDAQAGDAKQGMQMTRVMAVSTDTLTLAEPLVEALTTTNTGRVTKITPLVGFELSNLRLDDNGNSHATSRGFYGQYLLDPVVTNIWCTGFTAAGVLMDYVYGGFVNQISTTACGNASESDQSYYRFSMGTIDNLISRRATGFGPQFLAFHHSHLGKVTSSGATGRGIKLHTARYFTADQLSATNSASTYTGVSISQRSRHGSISSVVACDNGAAGLWFADSGTTGTGDIVVGQVVALRNAGPVDIQFGSTVDSVTIANASYTNVNDAGTGCVINGTSALDRAAGLAITNNSTEQTIYTRSIAANQLGLSRGIKLTMPFVYLNNSGGNDTFRLKVKFGATTIFNDITPNIATDASYRAGMLEILMQNRNATNVQVLGGRITISAATSLTAGFGDLAGAAVVDAVLAGTSAEDSTAAKTFLVTVQHTTASANISFERYSATLELV